MGRAVATKGQRRLGRTIRKLESSVEFSSKENKAKLDEQQYRQKTQPFKNDDSPVENLQDAFNRRKQTLSQ
jgi:hypothetical protein